MKIKQRLRQWLGVDNLESEQRSGYRAVTAANRGLENRISQMEKLVQVGVDIHCQSDSWAVICIEGKPDYVKFVRLPKDDIRAIQRFLNQFKGRRSVVDVPPFIREFNI